jgi:PAS domain S-box-containing protein
LSRLSLRIKTLIFVTLVPLVAMVAAHLVSQQHLTSWFRDAERYNTVRDVERGRALVDDLVDQLELLTQDWAQWDDMYAFVGNGNSSFYRANLRPESFRNLKLHQVLLVDPRGKLIYHNCFGSDWKRQEMPPLALLAQIQPRGRLLGAEPAQGLLATADGVLVVSSWPIVRSDGSGAPRGTLIFARFLNQLRVRHLSELGNLELQIVPISLLPGTEADTHSAAGGVVVVPESETHITGYLPLNDLSGVKSMALKATVPRAMHLQGQGIIAHFSMVLLAIIGLSGLLLLLGLEFLVLRRVTRASAALSEVAASGDVTARLPQDGADELGSLIVGINDALAAIERDVDEQKAASREMARLNKLVISFLTHTPMGLFVKEYPSGRYLIWNPAAEDIYGHTASEVIGKDAFAILDPEHAERVRRLECSAIETGEMVAASDESIVTPEGDTRQLHVRKVPLPASSDDQAYIVGIVEDVTEYREQQARLQKTLEELAQSNTELEQFAYVASHDLQEPLRMVASYVQLLARRYRGQLDSDADEFIAFAVDGATRMQGLINDLLAYSRVGTQGKDFAPLALDEALATALQNLRLAVGETEAEITHEPLPRAMVDKGQLVQLLQNLVANALKFRREEAPRIHISARQEGEEWIIGVQDNGVGIEPQYLNRIFAIFQRLYTRQEYPGTGIGLAICKRIVERHGGRLWVESVPGEGSTFYFTLPYHTED